MGHIWDVQATPGGSVRLVLHRDGTWRVIHRRPEVKSRLGELYGLASWGGWGGFVTALLFGPLWLLFSWAGVEPAATVTGVIAAVGAGMAALGVGMAVSDIYELFGGVLYLITIVLISPFLLIPAFRRSLEYTVQKDVGAPIPVSANSVAGAWLATRGDTVAVTLSFHHGTTVTYEAAGRSGTKLLKGFSRLLGPRLMLQSSG
ncbi:hypothetical protein AB0J80_21540 [Actinoplanes sp. NPDC049548]|uniref:hypothetical protein n=1 Tax=Actinoplanes sp. NPDC049548 TaxID=3155152 RepID=UPI00341D6852